MAPHADLREMAFQMRSADLRQYGQTVLRKDPTRTAAAEVLDLMAHLVACDYVSAEAAKKILEFKYQGTKDEIYVKQAIAVASAHIDFAFGRFKSAQISANVFLEAHKESPDIEGGEYLDIMRILAQKHLIMDEYVELRELDENASIYKSESNSPNILYLINAIKAMRLLADGEFKEAMELATLNLRISEQHKYSGLMAPIDSMYVIATCYMAIGKRDEAYRRYSEIKVISKELEMWPWYLIASGYISRHLAQKRELPNALAVVREERELLKSFTFKHELDFIPDVNELYIRFLIGDKDRLDILFERVPPLGIVEQIKAFQREQDGEDMLSYIEGLPEVSSRERVLKNIALSDYYKDKERTALEYMQKAIQSAEKSGAVEVFVRQYHLAEIILRACAYTKSVFAENLASLMAERIAQRESRNTDGANAKLTSRELEVVRHLSTGRPISSISASLHVSMNTMKTHLRNIYRKLEVDGRDNAVAKAKELLLI